jgi:energy-coupling factor transport system ATP-binding protein
VWSAKGDPKKLSVAERLGAVTLVPQRASDLLFLNTLAEELAESDRFNEVQPGETAKLFLQLSNRTDPKQHPRDLSAGQQLALVLAVQLVKGAPMVLLDEPTRGLDYEAKRHLASAIEKLKASGRSVLLASHDVEFVAQLADRIYLLEAGLVKTTGTASQLLGFGGVLPTQVAQITEQPGLLLAEQVIAG